MDDQKLARAARTYSRVGSLCLWLMLAVWILWITTSVAQHWRQSLYWLALVVLLSIWLGSVGALWRELQDYGAGLFQQLAAVVSGSRQRDEPLPQVARLRGLGRTQWLLAWLVLALPPALDASSVVRGPLLVHLLVLGYGVGAATWLARVPALLEGRARWLRKLVRVVSPDASVPAETEQLSPPSWPLRIWSISAVLLAGGVLLFAGANALEGRQRLLLGSFSLIRVLQVGALAAVLVFAGLIVLLPLWARRAQRFQQELARQGQAVLATAQGAEDRSAPRPEVERLVLLGRLLAIAGVLAACVPLLSCVVFVISVFTRPSPALLALGVYLPMAGALYCMGQFCRVQSLRWQVWVELQDTLLQKIELGQWQAPPPPEDAPPGDASGPAFNPDPLERR